MTCNATCNKHILVSNALMHVIIIIIWQMSLPYQTLQWTSRVTLGFHNDSSTSDIDLLAPHIFAIPSALGS